MSKFSIFFFFFKSHQVSLYWIATLGGGVFLGVWYIYPGLYYWRKLTLSQRLSIVNNSNMSTFRAHARNSSDLILNKSCGCCHSCCDFICAVILLFPENIVSLKLTPSSMEISCAEGCSIYALLCDENASLLFLTHWLEEGLCSICHYCQRKLVQWVLRRHWNEVLGQTLCQLLFYLRVQKPNFLYCIFYWFKYLKRNHTMYCLSTSYISHKLWDFSYCRTLGKIKALHHTFISTSKLLSMIMFQTLLRSFQL